MEDDVGVAVSQADALGLVGPVGQVAAQDNALLRQIDDVKEAFVGRIAIGQIGVAAADDAALPDVDAAVEADLVEHVGVRQVNLATCVGVGEAGGAGLFEQLIVAVASAVGIDEAVPGIEAPVDRTCVAAAVEKDLLDDTASFQRDIGHIAAVFAAAGGDVQQRELRAARGFLHAEAGVVAVGGIAFHQVIGHHFPLLHVEDTEAPLVVQDEGVLVV